MFNSNFVACAADWSGLCTLGRLKSHSLISFDHFKFCFDELPAITPELVNDLRSSVSTYSPQAPRGLARRDGPPRPILPGPRKRFLVSAICLTMRARR